MENQFIITIGRKCGSGGTEIASLVARKLGVNLYSQEMSDGILLAGKISYGVDENSFICIPGRNRDMAIATFASIRSRAEAGESFVVLGRCADYILRDLDCATRVFITADKDWRIGRTALKNGISDRKVKRLVRRTDRKRKAFHNRYCSTRWGGKNSYDYIIDSTEASFAEIADNIISFIKL